MFHQQISFLFPVIRSWSSFGTPIKKLIVDCSVVLTPLQPRNSNKSHVVKRVPTPACTTMEDPKEKENFEASPVKSSVARKLLVSPPAEDNMENDAYAFPPLRSPTSAQKAMMPAESFYKKGALYVGLLERKLIKETKSNGGVIPSPSASNRIKSPKAKDSLKFKKNKRPPSQKKRAPSREVPSPKTVKKVEGKETTAPVATEIHAPSPQKSAILGLKVKQRPKLTMGAAFFATSKRPYSSRKLPAHIKFPLSSKPKPSQQSSTQSTGPLPSSDEKVKKSAGLERMSREKKSAENIKTSDLKDGKPKSGGIRDPQQPKVTKPPQPSRQDDTEAQVWFSMALFIFGFIIFFLVAVSFEICNLELNVIGQEHSWFFCPE